VSQGEKPAYQDRSRRTREKIVTALDAALKEKPFDQVSVAEIAQRAGIAVGTVYRRFENKDALIPVIFEIYKTRVEAMLDGDSAVEVEPNEGLRSVLQKVMRKTWTICAREAHLLRAVHLYARLKPELANGEDWKKYEQASAQSIAMIINHYAAQVKRKKLKRASAFVTYMINSAFIEKSLYPDEAPATFFPYSGKTLADEFADMLYAYLSLPDQK